MSRLRRPMIGFNGVRIRIKCRLGPGTGLRAGIRPGVVPGAGGSQLGGSSVTCTRIFVEPLTPAIGAEVSGVDLREPLDDETYAEVRRALLAHGVIFFRDQSIDHEQHLAFGRRFGELHIHPASPCVDGRPELMRVHTDAGSTRQNGHQWHSDVSCDEEPPMGSVLHLHTVPEHGGDTLFSSMYAAWDALSEPMKALLAPLEASHESAHLYDGLYGGETVRRRNVWPSAVHPVVRTHPETGRKALFVNSIFTRRILGVTESESRALLALLFEHVANPHFQCRFRWRANSIAFWDNRCVQHHAMWDYHPATRSGTRVTVAGDRPYH